MPSYQVALGVLSFSLLLLAGCAIPAGVPRGGNIAGAAGECPPLFGKVCYGPTDRPDMMRCGCSSVSPLGTPYP